MVQIAGKANVKFMRPKPKEPRREWRRSAPAFEKIVEE